MLELVKTLIVTSTVLATARFVFVRDFVVRNMKALPPKKRKKYQTLTKLTHIRSPMEGMKQLDEDKVAEVLRSNSNLWVEDIAKLICYAYLKGELWKE